MSSPSAQVLFIFPGQGSQYPGIGSDLCQRFEQAEQIYQRASDVAGYDLKELSFNDPDDTINLTRFTQPVLLTHAIASYEVFNSLTDHSIIPGCVAGHSLGEYSALVASGAMSFENALSAVIRRGELMSELGTGEMTAFSANLADIQAPAENHYCAIAGCNLPDQTVVGGHVDDLTRLEQYMQEHFPRKRFARLKTEGAFHTYYMVGAAQQFRQKLDDIDFLAPQCAIASNYSGGWHDHDADSIRTKLFYQLFNPVLWHQNLLAAHDAGVNTIIEFGGGIGSGETPAEKRANLEGIVKKTFRQFEDKPNYYCAINCETIESTVEALNQQMSSLT